MITKLSNFIKENNNSGTLFVIKGYDFSELGFEKIKLSSVINNKIDRLLSVSQSEIKVISFEEFICLYNFAVEQFKQIYIIENQAYQYFWPVNCDIDEGFIESLLKHYDEDADENTPILDIDEYINIFSNFVNTEFGLTCCYNIDENALIHPKIQRVSFNKQDSAITEIYNLGEEFIFMNICNDIDYFRLVKSLYSTDLKIAISWESYFSSKSSIENKITILVSLFRERVFAYVQPLTESTSHSIKEVRELMMKYWGYAQFRSILIYDLQEVQNKNKKVLTITQEKIINDLIEQVEYCVQGKPFRDMFVTAPTGSGKSLMFQLPAMHLAEKYNLVTLVITPLIGLMNDQVQQLEKRGYTAAKTINSDISPIIKQEILDDVSSGKCHILYLSPESLLSRSDVQQLIGNRKIGMVVIDEAHIVTTWGKQFRPDYWYLGDHVQKIRRAQARKDDNPSPFIVATFTATAIYEGNEDMYHETLNSMHMIDPITYLGYVRRENIEIEISEIETKKNKTEYEINKFDALVSMIDTALKRNKKTLIYFPTVALINRFFDYCYSKNLSDFVTRYHGQLSADMKDENFHQFQCGEKLVMLATKAFGMGIDIPDISIVSHFAPTGNVCDYMQEVGRAARDITIQGKAIYKHMSTDFMHINRLHGLSAIQRYQLVEVIKKILDIYNSTRYKQGRQGFTKKRNELLIDAESFLYIFESPFGDDSNLINKVKTAMLLIQKDYENRGFAPFHMRPIPMFAYGYFTISPKEQIELNRIYGDVVKLVYHQQSVCLIDLSKIWSKKYENKMSFPKFKFMLYSKDNELDFNKKYKFISAMSVDVFYSDDSELKYMEAISCLKSIANESVFKGKFFSNNGIIDEIAKHIGVSKFRAEGMASVFIAAMDIYQKDYSRRMNAKMYTARALQNGDVSYQFLTVSREFFAWVEKGFAYIKENVSDDKMYVVNDAENKRCKEIVTLLGILEAFGILRFKALGGTNSQIYIYVNETKTMQMVRDKPNTYHNRLLETINGRHEESVNMLRFLFQNKFTSDEVWDHLENYFLGILPIELQPQNVNDVAVVENDVAFQVQVGENMSEYYQDWESANDMFDNENISNYAEYNIPLADYYAAKLIVGQSEIDVNLLWVEKKIALIDDNENTDLAEVASQFGWKCIPMREASAVKLAECF